MTDRLVQLFADVLEINPAELNDDSSPDTVKQWDSLASMKLVVAIEKKFNIKRSTIRRTQDEMAALALSKDRFAVVRGSCGAGHSDCSSCFPV